MCMSGAREDQKRAPDPLAMELLRVVSCADMGSWKLSPGTLQEQTVLLAAEESLQPHNNF